MLQAQATTRASANRRLALVPTLTGMDTSRCAEDETCFHVFESSSKEAVLAATERAAFAFPRIAEAVA